MPIVYYFVVGVWLVSLESGRPVVFQSSNVSLFVRMVAILILSLVTILAYGAEYFAICQEQEA
jgi:hypothetical protein